MKYLLLALTISLYACGGPQRVADGGCLHNAFAVSEDGTKTVPPCGYGDSVAYTPVVDPAAVVEPAQYAEDLRECKAIAASHTNVGAGAAGGAVAGAALGALAGAITGAIVGDAGFGASLGAGYGSVAGGAGGTAGQWDKQREIVRQCLQGRGYSVLY